MRSLEWLAELSIVLPWVDWLAARHGIFRVAGPLFNPAPRQ